MLPQQQQPGMVPMGMMGPPGGQQMMGMGQQPQMMMSAQPGGPVPMASMQPMPMASMGVPVGMNPMASFTPVQPGMTPSSHQTSGPQAMPVNPTTGPAFGNVNLDLIRAIKNQNIQEVQLILGGKPNQQDSDEVGWTPLHYAARLGATDIGKLLIDAGANTAVNQGDEHGDTPLHYAASEGHVQFVQMLAQSTANPNTRNAHGNTPVHYACFYWSPAVVQILIQAKGNISIPNNDKQTPLAVAPERFRNQVHDLFAVANGLPTMQQRQVLAQQQMMQQMQQQKLMQQQQLLLQQQRALAMQQQQQRAQAAAQAQAAKPADAAKPAAPAPAAGAAPGAPPARAEKKPWEIDPKDLKRERFIGKGGFGEVWLGEWQGTVVAIKTVLAQKISEKALTEFRAEVDILSKLRHPNICLFMGACLDPNQMCVVSEFMDKGSLYAVLHDKKIDITWKLMVSMATDAARGMNYLHCFKPCIMHRDLKSLNLLVDQHWTVKVTDFGLSVLKGGDQGNGEGATQQCGTPQWMAPELLRNEKYDEKADVYSFGIVLWEMYTRQDPYHGMNPMQVGMKVLLEKLRPPIPHHCPHLLHTLITECWADDPKKRPSFTGILDKLKVIKEKTVD